MATGLDYATLFILYTTYQIYYPIAVGIGATLGAVFSFLLGKYWAFEAKDQHSGQQLVKYIIVNIGSIALNVFGVMAVTELVMGEGTIFLLGYELKRVLITKIIVATCIGIPYNFFLQKNWVFK